jgi:hypothetical protein
METFDIDLEDLDLKSVDIKPTTPVTTPGDFKNISFNSNTMNNSTIQPAAPSLTVASSNHDAMPTGLNSDKAVDFGLDLLMNKKKIRPDAEVNKIGGGAGSGASGNPSPTPKNTFNSLFNDNQSNNTSGGFPEKINLDNTDVLQKSLFDDNFTNIDLDKELNTMDLNDISKPTPSMNGPSLPNFSTTSANGTSNGGGYTAASATSGFGTNSFGVNSYSSGINTGGVSSNVPQMSFEEIQQKKFDLLCKFERLRDKGVRLPKTFSMSSSYEEMDMEYRRLIEHRQLDNSVKTQKRMLLSFVSGVEMLNGKFDPFELQLNGWSENVNESLNDGEYDQIFEDLFYKYKDTINMAPEIKLAGMIAMSGFWYHITQNMAKSFMPNLMNNVMRQNPDLMNQFQQATMNSMKQTNPGFAQFATSMGSGSNAGGPPKYNPMNAPPFANPRDAPPRGQTNINSSDDIDALIESIGN